MKRKCEVCQRAREDIEYIPVWRLWTCEDCYHLLVDVVQREMREILQSIINTIYSTYGLSRRRN